MGVAPFGEAVLESPGVTPTTSTELDCFVSEHAVRPAAVGDDIDIFGQAAQPSSELFDRDRDRSGDMPGGILGVGSNVDNDHLAVGDTSDEVVAADLFQVVTVAEVDVGEIVDGVVVASCD